MELLNNGAFKTPHESTQQYLNGLRYRSKKNVEQWTLLKRSPYYSTTGASKGSAEGTRDRKFALCT